MTSSRLRFVVAVYEHYGPDLGFSAAAVLASKKLAPLAPVGGEHRLDQWLANCNPIEPFVVMPLADRDGHGRRLWRIAQRAPEAVEGPQSPGGAP